MVVISLNLGKQFTDPTFKSRQDILVGESRVFTEQSALGGFAEDGQRVDELRRSCPVEFFKMSGSDANSLTIIVTNSDNVPRFLEQGVIHDLVDDDQ